MPRGRRPGRPRIGKKRSYTRRPLGTLGSPSIVSEHPKVLSFHVRPHGDGLFRVWLAGWHGNEYEVMNAEQLSRVRYVCSRFAIPLVDQEAVETV